MPWSEWLEPKEEEVADDVLVVMVEPGKKVVIVQLGHWVVCRLTCRDKPRHR